jgi:hypothetical protein
MRFARIPWILTGSYLEDQTHSHILVCDRFVLMQVSPDVSDRPAALNFPADGANGFFRSIGIYLPYHSVTPNKTTAFLRNIVS